MKKKIIEKKDLIVACVSIGASTALILNPNNQLFSVLGNLVVPFLFGLLYLDNNLIDTRANNSHPEYKSILDAAELYTGLFSFSWLLPPLAKFLLWDSKDFKDTGLENTGARVFLFFAVFIILLAAVLSLRDPKYNQKSNC